MILAATDFTNEAREAARLAAAFARATRTSLRLVYVLEPDALSPLAFNSKWVNLEEERLESARTLLRAQADELRGHDLDIDTAVIAGDVTVALTREAHASRLDLVVVGGCADAGMASHRGIAEELANALPCPLLVARPYAAPLIAALHSSRRLRLMVAVDDTVSADAAIDWTRKLRDSLPCDILVRRYYWPPFEHRRLGIPLVADVQARDPRVAAVLEREVRARFVGLGGQGELEVQVEPRWDAMYEGLARGARDVDADLVVVGAHQRGVFGRVLHASTSRHVLRFSDCPIVCVGSHWYSPHARPIHNVLVAADLSDLASVAVQYAYEIVRDGLGKVTILTVVGDEIHGAAAVPGRPLADTERRTIVARLRRLVPEGAELGIKTEIVIEEGDDTVARILAMAERLDADAIVVGSHSATGVARAMLGSVSRQIAERSTRPVLIARHRPL